MLGPLDAAKAHRSTIIVRAVQSSGNGRSCRSASVDWLVSAARRANDPHQTRLLARRARQNRSHPKRYAHGPHGKLTASRRTAAGLRSAVPAPLPTSAPDRMPARGRLPKCSGTNAPTPPMIGSRVSPIASPNPSWSCDRTKACSRAVASRTRGPGRSDRASRTWSGRHRPAGVLRRPRHQLPARAAAIRGR